MPLLVNPVQSLHPSLAFLLSRRFLGRFNLSLFTIVAATVGLSSPIWGTSPAANSSLFPTEPSPEVTNPTPLAQATAGNTITLNGISASIPWRQANGQISVADYALTNQWGGTLVDTENPQMQPMRWFSAPAASPVMLPAMVESGYRWLDIGAFAQAQGWTVAPVGTTLQITTPNYPVQSIRREIQPWGERLTIQTGGPVAAQLTERSGEFTLMLGAATPPGVLRTIPEDLDGSNLSALQVVTVGGNTRLSARISGNGRPRLTTLANPNRIVVEVRPDFLQPLNIAWARGVRWQQRYVNVGGKAFPVYWLQIDPRQTNLTLRPIWTDPLTATGTTPLLTMAQRWQATAAINAGFFNRNNQYPLGAIRYGEEWISGPILSRGVVGWDAEGQVRMDRLFLRQAVTTATGQTLPIQTINSGYVQAGIGMYTSAWGPTYQPVLETEIVVTVVDGIVTAQQATAGTPNPVIPIPPDGYLLALRSYTTAAPTLAPGTALELQSELLPDDLEPFPNIVGGGPLLIRNQAVVLNPDLEQFSATFARQAAPRSAIGLTPAGDLLLVAVHQGPSGPGPSLAELATIMAQLGSVDALNLDGGSSASLYLGGRLINRPSSTAARVNNGIGLFLD